MMNQEVYNPSEPSHADIDRIHKMWSVATTEADLRAAVRLMCETPSMEWRRYLDDLFLSHAKDQEDNPSGLPALRIRILAEAEDALWSSTAEAIARADHLTTPPESDDAP